MNSRIFPISVTTIHQTYEVIGAFYHEHEPMTTGELARRQISGLQLSAISGNVSFLKACGVLRSPSTQKYILTSFGRRMGEALAKDDWDTVAHCCATIVTENSPFLADLWRYILQQFDVRGELSQEAVKTEIVRRIDRRRRGRSARTGAKTILDIMYDAGFLERRAAGRGQKDTTLRLGPAAPTPRAQDNTARGVDSDAPPDFSKYVEPWTEALLRRRWRECILCLASGETPIAAGVMIGGLLETLLYLKMSSHPDQALIFRAPSVPCDRKTKQKAATYENWTLKDYIAVAYDLGWIKVSKRESAKLVQEYRNIIHPFKQVAKDYDLSPDDAGLSWVITKNIARVLYP